MAAIALLASVAACAGAEPADLSGRQLQSASALIENVGKGTVALSGPWKFHPGDDASWSAPLFDDSSWTPISADQPWGMQGHKRLTGVAWYRLDLRLSPAPGAAPQFSLLFPFVGDAYEVYWNGRLIGKCGSLEPKPIWYSDQAAQIVPLGTAQRGVLAVRVWKAPLLSDDSGEAGGFEAPPQVGTPESIATAKAALDYQWLYSRQFLFGENLLYALIALMSVLLWRRRPTRKLLFWMAGFTIVPPLNLLLLDLRIPWPYTLTMGLAQPLAAIRDISLWFLLLHLLLIQQNSVIARLTRIFAWIAITNAVIDGLLIALVWTPQWIWFLQSADAISALAYSALQAFPLVLAGHAFLHRERLNAVRTLLAALAFSNEMILVVRNVVKQGRQYTNWSIGSKIESPLFTIGGSAITLYTLAGALLLIAIIYAVGDRIREDQHRQDELEREKAELMNARERMRFHAEHDGLTGIWNHRIIVDRLDKEVSRSLRDDTPLSVILADIDYFKRINDTYGHPAGDLVLKEISALFIDCLRDYDWVGRYGGEEFLLILPNADLKSAITRAEQLRDAVRNAVIIYGETQIKVTASFGVVSGISTGLNTEAVIRCVDSVLYRAKNSGRNCVAAAELAKSLRSPVSA
jgi:diguanylate cyclase (GGDEF)-like protein